MSAHTPEPWTVDEDRAGHDLVISGGPLGTVVCLVVDDEEERNPDAIGNARLIAAAPYLLAALEKLADYVRADFAANAQEWSANDVPAYIIARAAIAAARGES